MGDAHIGASLSKLGVSEIQSTGPTSMGRTGVRVDEGWAVIAAIAAAAVATFNLACVGTTDRVSTVTGEDKTAFSRTYRVDLDRKLYCEGSCAYTLPVDQVLPTLVVFDEYEKQDGLATIRGSTVANRSTGELKIYYSQMHDPQIGDLVVETKATCTVVPFTGFPPPAPPAATRF